MEIDLQTKIGALLEAYPELEKTLLELSPAFANLRSPVLRRTVGKVATVQQAAKIGGIPPAEMVRALRKAAGLAPEVAGAESGRGDDGGELPEERPGWLDESKVTVRFDAAPVIDSGASPKDDIIRLCGELQDGEIMELSVPFRPEPIMDILRYKGFKAWYGGGKAYFLK